MDMTEANGDSPDGAAPLEQQVRGRIETLSYLPTTANIAIKFIELGKNPEADPGEYAKVISSDSSLSARLLSLSNSSWFGVRNKVTKVQVAVNLLGLGTVRTLAISYCATGLHNELHLDPSESKMFWLACLCKAVAAKVYASLRDEGCAEEAFAAGLFQDFAIPVMYATAKDRVLGTLTNQGLCWKALLEAERASFHLDHAELARSIAQKMELPDLYVDAVAFHHNHEQLRRFIDREVLADAIYAASLFPHVLEGWNTDDAEELRSFVAAHAACSPEEYLEKVQQEFDDLYRYFEQGAESAITLSELMASATKEIADNTTRLVGTMHDLMQQIASSGQQMHQIMREHDRIEEAAARDALTGAFNRDGFFSRAEEVLAQASRYGIQFAVAYVDIDRFKRQNDQHGHAHGDVVLRKLVETMRRTIGPEDLIGRLGGDEFVMLVKDRSRDDAEQTVRRLITETAGREYPSEGVVRPPVTVSAGVLWVNVPGKRLPLEKLIETADALMYEAKRRGGNDLCLRTIDMSAQPAA